MPDLAALLHEFQSRFLAGERPAADDYLQRAGAEADELATMIDGFLQVAPPPEPAPEVVAAVRAIREGAAPLTAVRARTGMRRESVVAAIMTAFGLSAAAQARVAERYHELESGLLDVARVDARLVDVVAGALGLTRDQLSFGRPATHIAAMARPRPEGAPTPAMAAPPAEAREQDEVDRIFGVSM